MSRGSRPASVASGDEDQRELAPGEQRARDVRGREPVQPVDPRGDDPGHDGEHERDGDRGERRAGDAADVAGVDRDAEREEEQRRERVPQRCDEMLDAAGGGGAGEQHAGHERADRVGDAELERDAGDEEREADAQDHEQLVVAALDQPADPRAAVARRETEDDEEPGGTREQQHGLARGVGAAEHRRERGQVQREEEVLEHDDPEDQLRLGVVQPVQLHEQLGDDRRRRHAGGAGDDERLLGAPADREAEREPGADVEREIDRRRREQARLRPR